MTFGEKLKVLRKNAGVTQAKLAAELGITPRTLINYEQGSCTPKDTEIYVKAAAFFDVPLEELFGASYYAAQAQKRGGSAAKRDMESLLGRMSCLFAGGELSEEDRDKVMRAVSDMYWKSKEKK